jgi:protein SCO1/2
VTPLLLVRKNFIRALIVINLIAVGLIFLGSRIPHVDFYREAPASGFSIYAQMPAFELTERSGKSMTDAQMRGKFWVANFMFTQCPNQCPLMNTKFSLLQKSLPDNVRLASFSVDPLHDTPEKLRAYAANFGAEDARWYFLTGEKATLERILNALHLGNGEDPNLHSLRFVLMDEKLRVRGYYNSEDPAALSQLKRDLEKLMKIKNDL